MTEESYQDFVATLHRDGLSKSKSGSMKRVKVVVVAGPGLVKYISGGDKVTTS